MCAWAVHALWTYIPQGVFVEMDASEAGVSSVPSCSSKMTIWLQCNWKAHISDSHTLKIVFVVMESGDPISQQYLCAWIDEWVSGMHGRVPLDAPRSTLVSCLIDQLIILTVCCMIECVETIWLSQRTLTRMLLSCHCDLFLFGGERWETLIKYTLVLFLFPPNTEVFNFENTWLGPTHTPKMSQFLWNSVSFFL